MTSTTYSTGGQQNVVALNVAMQTVALVEMRQTGHHLPTHKRNVRLRHGLILHQLSQCPSRHKLHITYA